MTLSTLTSRISYPGTGSTGPFAIPFRFPANEDILVTKRAATGVETTLTLATHYTLTGAGEPTGTLTLVTALAIGEALHIRRRPANTQPLSIRNQGTYFPGSIEDEFDRMAMQILALQDSIDRSIKLKESLPGAAALVELEPTAGKVVTGTGTGFTMTTLDSSAVALPGNGRTVSTLSAYLANNQVLNVKDYGAVADGVANDTVAIQAALNAATAAANAADRTVNRGGYVRIPGGSYYVNDTLTIPRGVAIVGDGSEITRIVYGKTTGDVFKYTSPSALSMLPTIRLRGFRIDMANAVVHLSGAGINLDGTLYQLRPEIDDVYVFSTFNGVKLTNVQGGHMRMTNVAYCGGDGIIQGGFATLFHVDSCWSAACTGWGWNLDSLAYCHVDSCGADSNLAGGWRIAGPTGCTFTIGAEQNTGSNILLVNTGGGNKLSCRSIAGPATVDGLWIAATNGIELTPVIDTVAAATGYPLKLTGTCKSVVVHGADIGTYAAGAHRVSGADLIALWNDDGLVSISKRIIPGTFGSGTGAALSPGTMGIAFGNAAPTAGTWVKGDVVFNASPAVGSPKGWTCTVAGTPGTWVSHGNL